MAKKTSRPRKLNVYSNLSKRRKEKKDADSKRRAEYLATLPKHPVKRFVYRMHPKRFWGYWFSKRGLLMAVKLTGIFLLLMVLFVGALFAYFRKDLTQINPEELAKRVQTTVTKYYDRNNILLWEDKGSGNYKLTVKSDELSDNLKKATIAIEDKDFYKHGGVSITGTLRAVVNNATGGEVQGGSTLTQQLVKQVFFDDGESLDRGFGGIPRKIKEAILAIEVERTYTKDQILTLYLNESPYGGRRNGAESGAQTYFGKHAKDLSLAEAALLASIPQNPTTYYPYNVPGHDGLISRQHTVLDNMQSLGYATKEQVDEAKAYPILDHLEKETSQFDNIKAPHFVQMVRSELESELGKATVGEGGLTVKTTLDYRIQKKLEEAMKDMFTSGVPVSAGFTNGAATVEDVKTGQIVAMMGSRSFEYPGYGQDNAATAYIQPGSTIKPLVYTQLFQQKPEGSANYGSGSILVDERIDAIYNNTPLFNADRTFKGPMTIRSALATSRNIPAVEAMYISGVKDTLDTIHNLGGSSYCTQGVDQQAQLSSAIGGCGIKQVDLVNAYASVARGGTYKPQTSILEVKNSSGEVLQKWADTAGKEAINPQSAYIVSDILTDEVARQPLDGYHATGMWIDGVQTASKTGTSDKGGQAKDIWMVSYSPVLSMAVWLGNPDTSTLLNGTSLIPGPIIAKVMDYAHKSVYAKDGKWKSGDWFSAPDGIKRVGNEVFPSYWTKTQGQANAKLTFDRVSKRKATSCTPDAAKITLDVVKTTNPVTKKEVYSGVSGGYDTTKTDNVHKCSDADPSADIDVSSDGSQNGYAITATAIKGTFSITTIQILIDGQVVQTCSNVTVCNYTATLDASDTQNQAVVAKVTDKGYYSGQSGVSTLPPYSN